MWETSGIHITMLCLSSHLCLLYKTGDLGPRHCIIQLEVRGAVLTLGNMEQSGILQAKWRGPRSSISRGVTTVIRRGIKTIKCSTWAVSGVRDTSKRFNLSRGIRAVSRSKIFVFHDCRNRHGQRQIVFRPLVSLQYLPISSTSLAHVLQRQITHA
jgi:hypothetical protein